MSTNRQLRHLTSQPLIPAARHSYQMIHEAGPIDLVIWTYNSAKTLSKCLASIDRAIPKEYIHCKIAVDGNSQDDTTKILRDYDWRPVSSSAGIPKQANKALSLVDRPYYASFEHDVVLNQNWFNKLYPRIIGNPRLAVIQGLRVNVGSKLLEALDARYSVERETPVWFYSLDNNLQRTDVIRKAGGYPADDPLSTDGFLLRRLLEMGFDWQIDASIVSAHLKDTFWGQMKQQIRAYATSKILYESYSPKHDRNRLLGFLGLPLIGGRIAGFAHTPSAFIGYPLMKYTKVLCKGLYLVIHGKHRVTIHR